MCYVPYYTVNFVRYDYIDMMWLVRYDCDIWVRDMINSIVIMCIWYHPSMCLIYMSK